MSTVRSSQTMFGPGSLIRRLRVVQPSAQAWGRRGILNAADLWLAPSHFPVDRSKVRKVQKPRPKEDVPLSLKATKAIDSICDRYDRAISKPSPLPCNSEREWAKILGQYVRRVERVHNPITVIIQACSTFTRRNRFLYQLSYNILTVAHMLELDRTNKALDNVINFLVKSDLGQMANSLREAQHAMSKPLPRFMSPRGPRLMAGADTISILRREADCLRQCKVEYMDERKAAMVKHIEKCATAAGRVYRLAIELEVMKLDGDADFRTKKLNIQEALDLLESSENNRTRGGGAMRG